jgi:hypothetical protein
VARNTNKGTKPVVSVWLSDSERLGVASALLDPGKVHLVVKKSANKAVSFYFNDKLVLKLVDK